MDTAMHKTLCACLLLLLGACGDAEPPVATFKNVTTVAGLKAQEALFGKGVEQVQAGIWVAMGYGLANSILIEGEDGLIVIDTMESRAAGQAVAEAFRKLSNKPLRAIIYTHNHADHIFGAQAFIDVLGDPAIPVEVLAHESLPALVDRVVSEYRPALTRRSFRMFGQYLDDDAFVNNGLGPRLAIDANSEFAFVRPTRSFSDKLAITIAGVEIELVHAPGETDDQLFVWLPQQGVLCPGDNIYRAFPNLYTIRGTPYRSLKAWAASIDKMRQLPVRVLLPSHTLRLHGETEIAQVLTDYRDAIRYVHDQSVRGINRGDDPQSIAAEMQLPPHLAASPWLQEFYGQVNWSSKAVFSGNLGWFDGNPSQLNPLAPKQASANIAALAGGLDGLLDALQQAGDAEEHQWALELSDHIMRIAPEHDGARKARIAALIALGEATANPNARHYYLTAATELRDGLEIRPSSQATDDMLRALPLQVVFDSLAANLRAEDTLALQQSVVFNFTDRGDSWTLMIRRGVVEHHPGSIDNADIVVGTDSLAWRKLLSGQSNRVASLAADFDFERGGRVAFAQFLRHFRP